MKHSLEANSHQSDEERGAPKEGCRPDIERQGSTGSMLSGIFYPSPPPDKRSNLTPGQLAKHNQVVNKERTAWRAKQNKKRRGKRVGDHYYQCEDDYGKAQNKKGHPTLCEYDGCTCNHVRPMLVQTMIYPFCKKHYEIVFAQKDQKGVLALLCNRTTRQQENGLSQFLHQSAHTELIEDSQPFPDNNGCIGEHEEEASLRVQIFDENHALDREIRCVVGGSRKLNMQGLDAEQYLHEVCRTVNDYVSNEYKLKDGDYVNFDLVSAVCLQARIEKGVTNEPGPTSTRDESVRKRPRSEPQQSEPQQSEPQQSEPQQSEPQQSEPQEELSLIAETETEYEANDDPPVLPTKLFEGGWRVAIDRAGKHYYIHNSGFLHRACYLTFDSTVRRWRLDKGNLKPVPPWFPKLEKAFDLFYE
jgi:hypothetical protein